MTRQHTRRALAAAASLLLACAPVSAAAQTAAVATYPSRPLRIIVPFVAGGVVDLLARVLSGPLSESMGQPVLIEARPGVSTIVGAAACAKAPPDGYTVCITIPDSLTFNPNLFTNLPYDPDSDFAPVTNIGWTSGLVVASGRAPFSTYKEMVAFAKAKPGILNYATWGPASLPDIYLRWIRLMSGIDITAVPYKGAAQGNPALFAGEVDLTYLGVGAAVPLAKAGKVKPLVALADRRSPYMPEVPSLAEEGTDSGLRGYMIVLAPAKTPRALVDRLHDEFVKAMRAPKSQEFLRSYTIEPVGNSPEELAEYLRTARITAGKVFRSMGLAPSVAPK